MKKCPFCNAEIEENARFCLYCMSSLEEKQITRTLNDKKKWWLYMIAAVFALFLITVGIVSIATKRKPKEIFDKIVSDSKVKQEKDGDKPSDNSETPSDIRPSEKSEELSGDDKKSGSTNDNSTNNNGNSSTTPDNSVNASNTDGNTTTTIPDEEDDDTNVSPSPDTDTPTTTATYLYRTAKYGDDFSVGADLSNAIVITGVSTPSSDGTYSIPETIDNKKVVAIMGLAFSNDNIKNTVKKVIVPTNVKTIWGNAFANCYNLTDIYFCGNAIYVETNAFASKANRNGTLTIHCSYDCSDRNYRYYRNSATYYDAQYEEWND